MKKIISLVMALLLICNLGLMFVSAASVENVTISKVVYPAGQDYYKSGSDVVSIKGSCNPGKDIVIRVYDENESLIYTDTLLAHENANGEYEFTGFVFPATKTKGRFIYRAIVSELSGGSGAINIAKTNININEIIEKPEPEPNPGQGGGISKKVCEDCGKNPCVCEPVCEDCGMNPCVCEEEWDPIKEEDESEGAHIQEENQTVIEASASVDNTNDAEKLIDTVTKATSPEAMAGEAARNTIAISVETMMSNIGSTTIDTQTLTNKLILRESSVSYADLKKYTETERALNDALKKNNITLNRELAKEYIVNTNFSTKKKANITIYKGFVKKLEKVEIDTLTINDKNFRVSYSMTELKEMIGDDEYTSFDIDITAMTSGTKILTVNFDTAKTQSVKISFPGLNSEEKYMAIVDENGNPVGGRYNPATGAIETKISESGVYQVVNNEKDFEDIKNKSEEMQESIKILAAKGIIQGTSETTFSPDSPITRAEIAALLLRVLSQVDPNADGGFADVKQTDWFYGTAGSAKKYGMIKGFEDNTFRGNNVIAKDQILTVASRVLQKEMRYQTPTNVEEWLKFSDADKIAVWARNDIALATMANIITKIEDNTIKSSEPMTRGDASLIIMRLFYKIW